MKKIIFALTIISVIVVAERGTLAYAITGQNVQGEIVTSTSPENPGPHTTLTIHASSYSEDLNQSLVVWSLDGKTQTQAVGLTDFKFTTGEVGKVLRVNIRVFAPDGAVLEKNLFVNPAEVHLFWTAQSRVPAWYKGKALVAANSPVTVAAEPDFVDGRGVKIPASQLYYAWSRNYDTVPELSGYGIVSATFNNFNIYRDDTIGVKVRTQDGALSAESRVSLRATAPKIFLYEEHPLMGTLTQKALSQELTLPSNEYTLRAEPFFFAGTPTFSWQADNKPAIADNDNRALITLRQDVPGAGSAELACTASDATVDASQKINVLFGRGVVQF